MVKKDKEKKVGYDISSPIINTQEKHLNLENESTKFIVILLCIVAFIAMLWLVDTLKNRESEAEPESEIVSVNYNEVLVGNMLDQKYDNYLVYAYQKDDSDNSTIYNGLNNVEHYYKLDLDKAYNLSAVDTKSNFKGSLAQIKFKGTTLLLIEKGKIVKYYEGVDSIINYLNTLNK